ncbi:MAG: hypothetical protein MUD14_22195 [Hydrococcus sp. Prado102]|nr:hypothetical protein [Hydrococcus sp. Prado102]
METNEIKQIATQLLAGMLANPHIYFNISDEGSNGQQEQVLITIAIDMAQSLIEKIENEK